MEGDIRETKGRNLVHTMLVFHNLQSARSLLEFFFMSEPALFGDIIS